MSFYPNRNPNYSGIGKLFKYFPKKKKKNKKNKNKKSRKNMLKPLLANMGID